MAGVLDAIEDGIPEEHVGMGHVYLGAQHHASLLYLAVLHGLEEPEVLLDGSVAVGRSDARLGGGALLLGYLFGRLLIDVGLALADETDSEVIELLEIVGGVEYLAPAETEPADVPFDRVHVLDILLGGVGVVEAQVAHAVVLLGDAEVHADSLDVSDMQIAVGLGRKTCLDASVVLTFCQVFLYDLLNEIEAFFLLFHRI